MYCLLQTPKLNLDLVPLFYVRVNHTFFSIFGRKVKLNENWIINVISYNKLVIIGLEYRMQL